MTTCEKGDIVLVPFPFSSHNALKKRPAVIISSNRYNNISSASPNLDVSLHLLKFAGALK
ncbi:MAG: type II toxin-antitoxin system PemK/MazF family toxin [Nitrospirota bacterium]